MGPELCRNDINLFSLLLCTLHTKEGKEANGPKTVIDFSSEFSWHVEVLYS